MNNSTITTSEVVPPPDYSPKVAFIIGSMFIAFMVSIIIMALARKPREVEEQTQHQEGKEKELGTEQREHELWDAMAKCYKVYSPIMGEVASLGTTCFVIGFNFIILGLFQMNFHITFFVIVSVICVYGCITVAHFNVMANKCGQVDERMVRDDDVEINDRYKDFGGDLFGTILIGCVQVILIFMFTVAVYQNGGPDFSDRRTFVFYILGSLVQVAYTISRGALKRQAESNFFWVKMLIDCENDKRYEWVKNGSNKLSKRSILMRMILSYATNFVGWLIITALLPLQLAESLKPFDFVLNSVAAYFIIEFDDIEAKTIKPLSRTEGELQLIRTESNEESNGESPSKDDIEANVLNDQGQRGASNQ